MNKESLDLDKFYEQVSQGKDSIFTTSFAKENTNINSINDPHETFCEHFVANILLLQAPCDNAISSNFIRPNISSVFRTKIRREYVHVMLLINRSYKARILTCWIYRWKPGLSNTVRAVSLCSCCAHLIRKCIILGFSFLTWQALLSLVSGGRKIPPNLLSIVILAHFKLPAIFSWKMPFETVIRKKRVPTSWDRNSLQTNHKPRF